MSEEKETSRDVTRRELAEALAAATALIQDQKKALTTLQGEVAELKKGSSPLMQAELMKAIADLAASSRPVDKLAGYFNGPCPPLEPYEGYVEATADCVYGHRRAQGEVFQVKVKALWTDDPYVAVEIIGTREDGAPITRPSKDAPTPIDFRFRKPTVIAEDPTLRRAAEY